MRIVFVVVGCCDWRWLSVWRREVLVLDFVDVVCLGGLFSPYPSSHLILLFFSKVIVERTVHEERQV
jgi:hypothetical protein